MDFSGAVWRRNEDGTFMIQRVTETPWKHAYFEVVDHYPFKLFIVVAVLMSVLVIACCICCLSLRMNPKRASIRQSSYPTVLHPPPESGTVVTFQTDDNVNPREKYPSVGTGHMYSRDFENFPCGNSERNPASAPPSQLEDPPPEYSTVVSENFSNDKVVNAPYSQVSVTRKMDTPPPPPGFIIK